MSWSRLSGFYIVTLTNEDPLPVNPLPKKGGAMPITVMKANLKFGRAQCLPFRAKQYRVQFGAANVVFRPLAIVPSLVDLKAIESKVLESVQAHRVLGTTGRPTEWLQGISAADLERLILAILQESNRPFSILEETDLMSLAAADPWPPSPIAGTRLLVPISSWQMMLDETRTTGVEFDGFWLDRVEAGVAYFFRWEGAPRATVLAVWDESVLKHVECRGVGDVELGETESEEIRKVVLEQFREAGFATVNQSR